MEVQVTHWEHTGQPTEAKLYELLWQEGLQPYSWSNGPGDSYEEHSHDYDKVIYVAYGSIKWFLPEIGREIETRAGDRIDVPRGVRHAARVGGEGVTCLEAKRE